MGDKSVGDKSGYFTKREMGKLIQAAVRERPRTEAEIYAFLRWCGAQRIGAELVNELLEGALIVSLGDEPGNPSFAAV